MSFSAQGVYAGGRVVQSRAQRQSLGRKGHGQRSSLQGIVDTVDHLTLESTDCFACCAQPPLRCCASERGTASRRMIPRSRRTVVHVNTADGWGQAHSHAETRGWEGAQWAGAHCDYAGGHMSCRAAWLARHARRQRSGCGLTWVAG